MALTIRKLSDQAEQTLLEIQNSNEDINTNTKAIEYVLENYLEKCNDLENEKHKLSELRNELLKAEDKLKSIADGFKVITQMIA